MSGPRETDDGSAAILVVEDSRTQAEELRALLEAENFGVTVAHDGAAALARLESLRPDVIVSDIVMPGIDGYELCRRVKADERLRDIPVILLTSLSDAGDVLRGLSCGADNFFTKPYETRYLTQRIRYLLANRAVRREDHSQMAVDVFFGGRRHIITSDRLQILNLLISTYETAVQKNGELERARDELRALNEQLEVKVRERTAELERKATALRLSGDLLHVANGARGVPELVRGFVEVIRSLTGCAAVGVRVLDADGRIPYAAHEGFSERFFEEENELLIHDDGCWCGAVVRGATDRARPWATDGGSLVTNGMTRLFAETTEEERGPMREECRREGYESVALVPVRAGTEVLGLIHMADHRGNRFPAHLVAALESGALELGAALRRIRHEERVLRQTSQIQTLRAIDLAITSSFDHRVTLGILLDRTLADLQVDAADVLLLDPHSPALEFAAGAGFRTRVPRGLRVRLGEGIAGRAAIERKPAVVVDIESEKGAAGREEFLRREGIVSYAGVPLITKGRVTGVLEVFWRKPTQLDPERLEFFEALAGQAAIALDNAGLLSDLQRSNTELSLAWDATIEGWSRALDLRDKETEGHSLRVTDMTLRLGRALGHSEADQVHARRGALLHDIGKVGIPDAILLKPGPLTDEEWVVMRSHPKLAFDLLSPIAHLRPALDIPYCHHEKWDGTGYPRGLRGDAIPFAARIFAVVDVWDALRSDRPYRKAWADEKIRDHIASLRASHFDPRAAEAMLDVAWPSLY
ncbi:MAG: response regulator [Deltaproteobacteria bacterium]|nr:response regulator [Deltaproteobacteria bacterium]